MFLDQDAIPTLVEVKRGTDTRIRREVVGQLLEYAANAVVYWPVDALRATFEAGRELAGGDPEQELLGFLGEEGDSEHFWQAVKTNLQAGRVRLVFVADEVPDELRRIVEFLNSQMDPAEVLAVEVKQYLGQGQKVMVPRVIGQTAEARRRKVVGQATVRNYDDAGPLDVALEQCRARGDAIQVGHSGGESDLRQQGLAALRGRRWKWRDPATNRGVISPQNWILGSRFLQLVTERDQQ